AIFIIFAIQPTVKTIVSLQKSIVEQKEISQKLKEKDAALSQGDKNYQQLPDQVKKNLETMVPTKPNLPGLIADISSLAYENKASISGLQFQEVDLAIQNKPNSLDPQVKAVDFNLNLQGNYTQLT